ncbi:MAG: PH domain-containing protein [Oscillospiraceae bacterium]|nr:PH domain-containing protein [Oscillospiraceae bacterium]
MKNKNKIKIHPVYILISIKKFLFLLIIPLLRGLTYYIINKNIYSWLKGSWIDITILMIIIFLAVVRWRNFNIYLDEFNKNKLIISSGIFISKKLVIYKKNISNILIKIPFYYRPIGAIKITIFSFNKDKIQTRNQIILTKKNFEFLKSNYLNYIFKNKKNINNISMITTLKTAFLSLVMSDSLAGIIFISTFVSTSSKLLGYKLENELYGHFTNITKKLAFGFPPAGAAIAYILIIGWVIAFIRNLIIYINFSFKKHDDKIITYSGILNQQTQYINLNNINYIDIIQNIFTKIINLCSVFINIQDNKKNKKNNTVIVPVINKNKLEKNINIIFNKNINNINNLKIKPKKTSFLSYILFPVILFFIIFIVFSYLSKNYKNWSDFLDFIILMSGIMCFWLLIIKIINFLDCGISYQDNNYIIKYSKIFKFHTVIIPDDKISKIKIKQSFFQKYFKKYDILIYSFSNSNKSVSHKIKNINIFDLNFN